MTQPLQNYIGPTIRIGREILCLPYAGFLIDAFPYMFRSKHFFSFNIFLIEKHKIGSRI